MRSIFPPVLLLLLASMTANVQAEEPDSTNPYTKSYVSRGLPSIALQPDATGAKIYRSDDKEADYLRMLGEGYDMIGESSFEAGDVAPDMVKEQAAKVKADLVMVYTKLKASTPASVQIQKLRDRARQAKKDPSAVMDDEADDQQIYAYNATYWVRLAPPLIGVHVKQAKDQKEGLTIMAVVKNSPAAEAGLQADDVLTRIGEIELTKPEALSQAAKRYAGQAVEIRFLHEDQPVITTLKVNSRK